MFEYKMNTLEGCFETDIRSLGELISKNAEDVDEDETRGSRPRKVPSDLPSGIRVGKRRVIARVDDERSR